MTAEQVYHYYRGYKFYCSGRCRLDNGKPVLREAPPFIKQRDRSFYYRLSLKLNDPQIHALFIHELFFDPNAHVSTMVTPEALKRGLMFCGRGENGRTLLERDLYDLKKALAGDVQQWLYGIEDGVRTMMPGCLQQVIARELPLDIACLTLLNPQPDLQLDWESYWRKVPDSGLGATVWIDRLQKLNTLLFHHRKLWRQGVPQELAHTFWHGFDQSLVPQIKPATPSLF